MNPQPSSLPRVLGVVVLAGALTQLVLGVSGGEGPLASAAVAAPLTLGKPIERAIRKGETHAYEVVVPAGHQVNGVVDQRGVDVMVRVVDPSGALVATIDSPYGPAGPEPWSIDARTAGTWRIEVVPFPDTVKPGRYEARIDEIVTFDERDLRGATRRYRSPRVVRLWKERRADGAAAVDRFARDLEGHAPLVEPVDGDPRGDVLLTFARRVKPETRWVGLVGGPVADSIEAALARFEDTDLMLLTLRAPRDARFTYSLRPGEPRRPDGGWKDTMALFSTVEPDPWNPRRFGGRSLVELPAAPAQPWIARAPGVPSGRVVEATLHSDILHEDRALGVYLPAAFDPAGGPYPYVVVFDGEAYGGGPEALIPTPTILDNLIAQGKVPPMLAVLVSSGGTRERDLAMSAPFGEFLATELSPWVRRTYRATEDPGKVTLAGSSLGGLGAAYYAFHHPEVFGNALSQSGSFWFSPGAMEVTTPFGLEPGALMREVVAAPPQPVRVWMEVGVFEGGGPIGGSSQVAQNRHMRDVLLAKGYRVSYHEFTGGHDYACWRGSLADGLMELGGARR